MGDYFLLIFVLLSMGTLGIVVYKNDPNNISNRSFSSLLFWVFLWVIFNYFEGEVVDKTKLLILLRLDFAAAAWIAFFFHLFCLYFPTPSFKKIFRWVLALPIFIVSVLSLTPLVVKDVLSVGRNIQPSFLLGPLFWAYAPIVGGYIFVGILLMFKKMRSSTGLAHAQAFYVVCGMGISGVVAVVVNLGIASFMPISITVSRIGIYAALAVAFLPAYAVIRYRLLDVRVFIKETGAYLVTASLFGFIFAIIGQILSGNPLISICMFFACLVIPYMQNRAYGWLLQQKIRRGIVERSIADKIGSLADRIKDAGYKISDLAKTVVQIISDEYPVDNCSLYVMDYGRREYFREASYGFSDRFAPPLSGDDALIRSLQKTKDFLVYAEIERSNDERVKLPIMDTLNKIRAEVCMPLYVLDQMAGFIAIGPKKDEKPFFINDFKQLQMIGDETATALRYVLAVSIRAKETINWAHSLHQSLKPLTVGYDFLARRASLGGVDDSLKTVIPRIEGTLKKLGDFLRFLSQDSRISEEALRDKYELLIVNPKELIMEAVMAHRLSIDSKKINFVNKVDDQERINGHKRDLLSVFEILISNAIRYTSIEGVIEISGKRVNNIYRVEYWNNGKPIPAGELGNIFSDRFQIKDGNEGLQGIGLANAQRIIKMHKGKIWAENSENTNGVRFIIELPLAD